MNREHIRANETIPQEIADIVYQDSFLSSLPNIHEIAPVLGGVSHHIYLIRSGESRFFLKKRGDRFAQVPEVSCNPDDIFFECQALSLFNQIAPENFPDVLSFNREKSYLVLSDAMPNGEKMEDLFLKDAITPKMLFFFGQTLRRIHDFSSPYRDALRPDGDKVHYEAKLQHRFGYRHHPVLDNLVDCLRNQGDKQLILGDVAPKNIGANNNGELFIFFDLEEAHRGDRVFDFGYFLGHALIHTFTSPEEAIKAAESYYDGYGEHDFDEEIVKKIALGIMLYRLRSIVPYPTHLTTEQKEITEQKIESILPFDFANLTWPTIIDIINSR